MDHQTASPLPGYRLQKVQLMNWGTFDSTKGQIHTVRPEGRTSLLIGQNGSGKSTLVDSILTLLVRPGIRNYNVAAGSSGGKRERDERSYLLGAYGHASSDSENRASTLYLRKEGKSISVLLASFENQATGRSFTIAQVLHGTPESKVEKLYCFAKEEKDIASDFADIKSVDQISGKLESRGFRTTRTFLQYQKWIIAETHMRPKALDVFNQTVAVKDIRSLTDFVRSHMLEGHDWRERIDDILNHFQQLSEAHGLLIGARDQLEALRPVVAAGVRYQGLRQELDERVAIEQASEAYFRFRAQGLFQSAAESHRQEVIDLSEQQHLIAQRFEETDEQIRLLKNDLESAGGERLRSLPFLLQQREEESKRRRHLVETLNTQLQAQQLFLPWPEELSQFEVFQAERSRMQSTLRSEVNRLEESKLATALRAHQLNQQREELEAQLTSLSRKQSNLPESLQSLRQHLCDALPLTAQDLPFAAELIAVRPQDSSWQSAIEMALRPLASSLLVPEDAFPSVSTFLSQTPLTDDQGRGAQLHFLRVGNPNPEHLTIYEAIPPQSLLGKLEFAEAHPLCPWIKAELASRFSLHCCDTDEELHQRRQDAITPDRLWKKSPYQYERDDRDLMLDPRHFMLGWKNEEKFVLLRSELERVTAELEQSLVAADDLNHQRKKAEQGLEVLDRVAAIRQHEDLDFSSVDREISQLLQEKQALESGSNANQVLTEQLRALQDQRRTLREQEASLMKGLGVAEDAVQQAEAQLRQTEDKLTEFQSSNQWPMLQSHFSRIEADLEQNQASLTANTLLSQEASYMAALRDYLHQLRQEIDPIEKALLQSMSRFLRKFRHHEQDLRDDPAFLHDFISLHDRLEREDLPRHEQRFRERLNEKVTTEIGILSNQLSNEREEILTRIETLNRCLETIDYDPAVGSFMQLDPKLVRDKEIEEFQSLLKHCLDDAFSSSPGNHEARFQRIETLIDRLREEPRWREKVTDVRRWFDFGARETIRSTGEERGYYSDSMGQSGGEKAKLAFTILVGAVVYQFDIDPHSAESNRFHFVVVDEMFSKIDDRYAEYALRLFQKFGLQLLIVAPFDAKAKITDPFVDYYMQVVKKKNHSRVLTMSSLEFRQRFEGGAPSRSAQSPRLPDPPSSPSLPPPVPKKEVGLRS